MIILLIGNMGGGKTICMTKYLYQNYIANQKVYANYKLHFKFNELSINILKDYTNSNKSFNNSSIGIDEAHIFLDSRNFMSKRNKVLSYFLLQSRKRKIKAYLTFQKYHQVDKRIRDNASYLIFCDSFEKIGNKLHPLTEGQFLLNENEIYIRENIFISDKILDWKHKKIVWFKANEFYNKYDTDEIINFNDDED